MRPNVSIPPMSVKRDPLDEQIASRIEEIIVQQHLQPGMKLPPERELAIQFGVSRPTVSIAIQLLHQRGLVDRKVGSGTRVREIPATVVTEPMKRYFRMKNCSILELMKLRLLIEPAAAEMAAQNASADDLQAIESHLKALEAAGRKRHAPSYSQADIAFHHAVATASHSEPFVIVLLAFQEVIITTIQITARAQWSNVGMRHHRQIYEAIRDREPARARDRMQAHLEIDRYIDRKILDLKIPRDLGMEPIKMGSK